jgi:hypothetical protein
MAKKTPIVFISYAREDAEKAKKIYKDLTSLGVNAWLDQESILPGQNWKAAINQAIKDCRYFLALLSQNSVNKRGYVQKELAEALNILDEFPPSEIFVIPVRLDDCTPSHTRLNDLHWADMFPNWEDGLTKIVSAIIADGYIKLRSKAVDIEPSMRRAIETMGNGLIESQTDKIRQFRDGRIAKIIAEETPVPLLPNGKFVMHLFPISGLDPAKQIDIKSAKGIYLPPLGSTGFDSRTNFDGLLTYRCDREASACTAYLQLFRNGAIETVDSWTIGRVEEWGKTIPSGTFEDKLISASTLYLKALRNLGIEPPILVMISMLGVKGYTMAVDPIRFWGSYRQEIDRDSLILPDILVEDYSSEPALLLRPVFDVAWQSTGFSGSPNYDENGKRKET